MRSDQLCLTLPLPLALLAALAWAWPCQGAQAETYLLTDLGTLQGTTSQARAINNLGLVAGWAWNDAGSFHAVVLSNSVLIDLRTLGGSNSAANGINESGQVAGWANSSGSAAQRAFVSTPEALLDLGALLPGSTNSVAHGINQLGSVVGEYETDDGHRRPFVYANGIIPLGFEGAAFCINEAGQIGGYEVVGTDKLGFIISGVDRKYVGTLGSNDTAVAWISTNDVAVGRSRTLLGTYHAFGYQDGVLQDLGTLGGGASEAWGVNSAGHIVGRAEDKLDVMRAFLFRKGKMFDLNAFLPPESGWFLSVAYAINDSGQIAGEGQVKGESHGFLLTPNFLEMALYPGLVMTGKIGRKYRIDYLDALNPTNAWQALTNLVLLANPHFFIDPRPVIFSNRLYRSVLLPELAR